jgi:ABC-type lipoprotein export system ATPase subunit
MAMMFQLEGVEYRYPKSPHPVLREVDLGIPSGATTVVLGPSGAGKSTLLYLLGLLWEGPLTAGRITYDGRDYATLGSRERARLRLREFGFALQSSYLLPHLSCAENLAMPMALAGYEPAAYQGLLEKLVDLVDDEEGSLHRDMNRLAGKVSGGQRQRYSVIRAIAHDPRVVFADEPFSSLDGETTDQTLALLRSWRDGQLPHSRPDVESRSLILVCHDVEVGYEHGDYFVLVERGGTLECSEALPKSTFPGGPDELRNRILGEARS